MTLKRTTVLSGNFAKKNQALTARGRAASENVQLVQPHNFGAAASLLKSENGDILDCQPGGSVKEEAEGLVSSEKAQSV